MSRSVKQWCGKTDDAMPPASVRLRIFERYCGTCYLSGIKIRSGMKWQLDHIVALINGGANVESNLAPVLVDKHKEKTAADLAIKSKRAAMAKAALGIKPATRPIPGPVKAEKERRFGRTPLPPRQLYKDA